MGQNDNEFNDDNKIGHDKDEIIDIIHFLLNSI